MPRGDSSLDRFVRPLSLEKMMSKKVFEGDEWKHSNTSETSPTRAEEQVRTDALYALGIIELAEWRARSNELSETTKWNAHGRI